ncbi:MAG: RNA polymerase sigma-70 factor [Flavobacteriaceae bacterium]|nr:RNA polymerase sigma-70 factor [Flavobacteriaceae bacterium]
METNDSVCQEHIYSKIYTEHSKSIWNFIYFKCGNQDEADDLVQEAFIKLWQNCAKVPQDKAKSFLYTVANNTFLNVVAHKKVVLKHQNQFQHHNNDQSPQYIMEENEFKERLQKAISNLTEGQRTAFLLNRIEGKKYREIAEILEISVKAVEKRMSLALKSLRKEIDNI